jgi:hypothetical protein
MVASRPGMRLRRCARRTGFEILNHTRPENKMAPEGAILFSGGEGGKFLISKDFRGLPEFVLPLEFGKFDD